MTANIFHQNVTTRLSQPEIGVNVNFADGIHQSELFTVRMNALNVISIIKSQSGFRVFFKTWSRWIKSINCSNSSVLYQPTYN